MNNLIVNIFFIIIVILLAGLLYVDYKCVQDCTAQGYMWMYCQRACGY